MIVNKYNNGNGGGGSGSTITVDAALSSSSTNPVQNKVITNTLNSLSEQIPVVDSAVTSASTNAVESQAVYLEIHGETASTQLEVSTAVTEYYFTYFISSNFGSQFNLTAYFQETNLPGWYGVYLKDFAQTGSTFYMIQVQSMNLPGVNKFSEFYNVNSDALLGSPLYFSTGNTQSLLFASNDSGYLDGTLDYWFVIDTNTGTAYFYKTLPVIYDVTGGMPSFDDLPVAQDGSPVKYYVYDGGKKVLSGVNIYLEQDMGASKGAGSVEVRHNTTTWIGNTGQSGTYVFVGGNEIVPGFKTIRDSAVITDAENALAGFTEQVTLTLGSDSQNTIRVGTTNHYLKSTDDSRYFVLDLTALPTGETYFYFPTISGTQYRFLNTLTKATGNYGVSGRYQLTSNRFAGENYIIINLSNNLDNNYLIIDKDLLIAEISDSLTITRTKNIQDQGYLTQHQDISGKLDTTAFTQAMASETARTESTYATKTELTGGTVSIEMTYSDTPTQIVIMNCRDYVTRTNYDIYGYKVDGESDTYLFKLSELSDSSGELERIVFKETTLTYNLAEDHTFSQSDLGVEMRVSSGYSGKGEFHKNDFDGTLDYYFIIDTLGMTVTLVKNLPTKTVVYPAYATENYVDGLVSGLTGSSITVDSALSSSSTNPVENRVITNALGNYVQSTTVRTIVTCTQAQYDIMPSHDPNTFYIITGVNS